MKLWRLATFGILLIPSWPTTAEPVCENWAARLTSVEGRVELQRAGHGDWRQAPIESLLCPNDKLRTGPRSRAMLVLNNQTYLRLDQKTTLTFAVAESTLESWLEILRGVLYSISRVPNSLKIKTPFVNAAIKGTEFLVAVDDQSSRVSVYEGEVEISNPHGRLRLASGASGVARAGAAPRPGITMAPEDAVQWALYYPPLLDRSLLASLTGETAAILRQSLADYQRGDLVAAFQQLEQAPPAARNDDFQLFRAGLLLTVGRVDEARLTLASVSGTAPASATAQALDSIILLARNNTAQALAQARAAVTRAPDRAIPWLTLSYAQQGSFELEAAENSALQATRLQADNALAWARLAELRLALGRLEEARTAAATAAKLAPSLAHALALKGFTALIRLDTEAALTAFEQALQRDSSYPLARLGLGLGLIRQGRLGAGREQLEIAALMNPQDALIRSYLGKAYYEERRPEVAAKELAMAKLLDPNDPTPWFYDAILQQTENRHQAALDNLQQAVKLNDNRAVYRSRLLLDKDLAARVVSLARIHQELGFEQTAINQSSQSLDLDPSNYSAHRFLFDSYSNRPRHESARVSELLQTQLLQPINMNPVQPELAETRLNILAGTSPSQLGFNEFTPLYERNGVQFTGGALYGSNETLGDQAVISGVHDRFSYSLGQFQYETDGFRENNEQRHKLYNVFTQAAFTENLSLQLEYRHRKSEEGDLRLNFDPNEFSRVSDREVEQDIPRLGLHYTPTLNSDFIASLAYSDREEDVHERAVDASFRQHGYDFQARYTYRAKRFNLTTGLGHYDIDGSRRLQVTLLPQPRIFLSDRQSLSGQQEDLYLYANVNLPRNLIWTLGLSYVSFRDGTHELVNFDRVNPKFGLQWQLTDRLRVRFAAMKSVKRSLVFEQTLEPTQIAAFNQFYDDFNGSIAKQYGAAFDFNITDRLFTGAEFSRRDLDVPRTFARFQVTGFQPTPAGLRARVDLAQDFVFEKQREDLFRAYAYWTPHPDWSLSAEFQRRRFRRNPARSGGFAGAPNIPLEVKTSMLPLSLRYFSETGFFASLRTTHVRQRVERSLISRFDKGKENFMIVDASVGYRLPKRHGLISLSANNLFDEDFLYQDMNIQNPDPSQPLFIPDQTFLLRLTLNF